ncbi:MAG: patatin-like phospholipase family protein [Gemmataceae bacterium]|nr:patatin-like phospholipase family protein [Gemmataceae bacterium]
MTRKPKRRRRQGLSMQTWGFVTLPLLLAVILGCWRQQIHSPPLAIIEQPWLNAGPDLPSRDGDVDAVVGLSQVLAGEAPKRTPGRPLNILVLSGGGKYGAFTAGVLVGWTASGQRPVFDVATGISSGAIVATLAFLGPKYDDKLRNGFTVLRRSDLFVWRPIRGLIRGTGLMSAAPLEELLAREITPEVMAELQQAYHEGRRLYIGTGNLITNRFTVWDLTAIAASGRPDAPVLVRKILLASSSVPGVVTPVEFDVEVNGIRYRELHGDAGNMAQAFVRTPGPIPTGSTFWILSAGKVYRDPLKDRPRVFGLLGGGVSNALYALFRSDLVKLYALCAVTGSQFRLIALPQDFPAETSSFAFDPEELQRMFWLGYQMAASGQEWRSVPPDTLPGEATPPRTGLQFVTSRP